MGIVVCPRTLICELREFFVVLIELIVGDSRCFVGIGTLVSRTPVDARGAGRGGLGAGSFAQIVWLHATHTLRASGSSAMHVGRASAFDHRCVQNADHRVGFQPSLDLQRREFPAKFIADRRPFEPLSVFGPCKDKVGAPHVVASLGTQWLRATLPAPDPLAFVLSARHS